MEAGTEEAIPAATTAANIMAVSTKAETIRKANTRALSITAANIITRANIMRIITPITATTTTVGITTPKVG